jgi:prepilin-type N-terminal cleavage/methylation domain-containing protein
MMTSFNETTTTVVDQEIAQAIAQTPEQAKRGFTLTEIAIVLGIIGLILGSIWVAAASVYQNLRVSKTQTLMLAAVQNIRSLYASGNTTGDTGTATKLTQGLAAAGVFPSDAVTLSSGTYTISAPWSGSSVEVFNSKQNGSTAAGDAFEISVLGIPQAACINLATSLTGSGKDPGLLMVNAAKVSGTYAGTAVPAADSCVADACVKVTFPVTATNAVLGCSATTATGNNVTFTFRVKG